MSELKIARVKLDLEAKPVGEPLKSSNDVAAFLMDTFGDSPNEVFGVINLASDGRPVNVCVISQGTLNSSLVHPRELFKASILSNASSIILFHNHPSGNLTPSVPDQELTDKLCVCGQLLGIEVLDHLIISPYREYLSFKSQGLISSLYTTDSVNEIISEFGPDSPQVNIDDYVSHIRRVR